MPNPFFFAGKITDPRHFVGREKELKRIFGYLDTAHTGQIQHASVVGERRIGKSSLLYHISQVYDNYLPEHIGQSHLNEHENEVKQAILELTGDSHAPETLRSN